ncbi:protein Dok-7-like isoform X5 [Nerophis ophidion]|uniref:protein Dok-7-like isoform X5 n=1 Tax=Nerophis ophidion TaxID=159077 RepID=UPI002ADFB4C7|nr:protein Dok-7-like isoform X5 [Nerophis ophidion]
MTESVVVEGYARLRDGKKWKTRWLVLRKPSPVADCLVLLVFKDKSDKAEGNKERATVTLEDICGLETGQCYEDVAFTLVILCLNQAALLGFDSRDNLQAWEGHLRYSLGEVHRFNVGVLAGTKLESGPATLHLCNNLLALVRDVPPVVIGHWNLPDLRRYGPVPNGFVFEGGTRCGYWSGVFLLTSSESEQISFLFDCIVREISPTRVPFGLMPILPDPGTSQTNFEEKLNHETQELEKRLSMLSNQNSMVYSTFSSDDRSISGSSDTSDTSQMDSSISSRLAIWTELPMAKISGNHPKVVSVEKLSANQGDGHNLDAKAPRQLQEIGRQSSSDSGIATGSHISYSGSLSSYTGSLDICEDFGSVFSLPPHLAQDMSPCCCAKGPEGEYKVPTSLRYLYDTPRNLIQGKGGQTVDTNHQSPLTESLKGVISKTPLVCSHRSSGESGMKRNDTESCHLFSSLTSKTIVTICATCGGFQGTPPLIINLASGAMLPAVPVSWPCVKEEGRRADPAYEIMGTNSERDENNKCKLMVNCGPQMLLQESEGTTFPMEASPAERPRSAAVTYVNIPVSPTSKKQLNYMELELQEHSARREEFHQICLHRHHGHRGSPRSGYPACLGAPGGSPHPGAEEEGVAALTLLIV